MPSYEKHCRDLGDLTAVMVDVVKECIPLQTFKERIDARSSKILNEVEEEMTSIGNDGLNMVDRARRPPCAILLGTSSAGKTELLTSFLPKLREFTGSTASDTTPMLVRLRYPHEFNPANHGKVTFLMPRDLFKLLSDLSRVRMAVGRDSQLAESWDRVNRIAREPGTKRDELYERKLYNAVRDWVREAHQWARVSGDEDNSEYFDSLNEITSHFDPDSTSFKPFNPVPRGLLISFLDKGKNANKLADLLKDKERKDMETAKKEGNLYYMMRTCGAITELFVEEDILKEIDVYDTAGVRVGGDEADTLRPRQMVHSQIQAFKNRWGFERLVASVDIIIFILVLEEQQVDTEFQALFDKCREFGNLQNRLFIFLNKLDKASAQAINKGDIHKDANGQIIPDDDATWKLWIRTNVMDKIRGLGDDFHNVFVCRAPKFKINTNEAKSFIENSKQSPILNRYLFDVKRNLDAALDDTDGGIKFAWQSVEQIMRNQGSQIRYERLGLQILPYAKDILTVLGAKRVTDEQPTDAEINAYLEKLLKDLEDLRWRNEEFHLPERFGEFCVQKKLVTAKQVEEALKIQEDTERDTGRRIRIGQILVDNNYMTLEQVREVLKDAENDMEDWDEYQLETFKHVRERVQEQIIGFMEDKGRPIIKGNIPVEAVINYLTEPIQILEEELKGLYTNKERKAFQDAVQNVMECQLTAALWNQERLRKHLWAQKTKITSSFHIRDDISEEEAKIVTACYDELQAIFEKLPKIEQS